MSPIEGHDAVPVGQSGAPSPAWAGPVSGGPVPVGGSRDDAKDVQVQPSDLGKYGSSSPLSR